MIIKTKKISVAICTYNGERFLQEQLKSIIDQTVPPDEIIICDDQSKDSSVKVAESILKRWHGEWRIFVNETNLGFKKNFPKAISLCHGDIIFLADQDDVWNPRKIEMMMPVFEDESVILAFHDAELVDERLNQVYPSFWETMNFDYNLFQKKNYRIVFEHNVMQGAACCFRKELFSKACPFPSNVIHDEWLLLIGLCEGKVIPVNKALLKYRQACNVIGGKPLTKLEKICKWSGNINKAIIGHITYLKYREYVFGCLKQKYISSNTNSEFYTASCEFYTFLLKRVQLIGSFFSWPALKEYEIWYFPKIARKQQFKDKLTFLDKEWGNS